MRQKRNMKFRSFCIVSVLFVGVIVGVSLSPIFNISEIKLNGNRYYSDDEIKDIIAIGVGDNWFRKIAKDSKLTLKSLDVHRYIEGERRLKEKCPYVKDIKIKLDGFGRYSVDIEEREPVALVSYLTTYVLVDKDGIALEITDNKGNGEIPKINGMSLERVTLGEKINMSEEKVMAFYNIYDTIRESDAQNDSLYSVIDYIDLNDVSNVKFFLDNRILVYFGKYKDINLYKINYLKEIFFNNIGKKEEGVLKFREKGYPTFTRKKYAMDKE